MSSDESETRTRILEATWRLMEERNGQGVRMRDVAEAAGVSRQAVYLHFGSRAELMVATARYGDEVRGHDERLHRYRAAATGVERLEACVEFWGNYIPEIYGMARALLAARETDEAVAAAWDDRMGAVREACRDIIERLHRDGTLAPGWSLERRSSSRTRCLHGATPRRKNGENPASAWLSRTVIYAKRHYSTGALDEAADLLWTMLSIRNWESLTIERGWSTSQYVGRMQELTKRAFVQGSERT